LALGNAGVIQEDDLILGHGQPWKASHLAFASCLGRHFRSEKDPLIENTDADKLRRYVPDSLP